MSPASCGGANGDFGLNGWKPRNKNVRTKFGRSKRSLRMQSTTASTSNFSSANSSNVINDCFDASGIRTDGTATYNILFSGLSRVSQTLYVFSVTWSFKVMPTCFFCSKICLTNSSQSSSAWWMTMFPWAMMSSKLSEKSMSEYEDELFEPTEVLRFESIWRRKELPEEENKLYA